MKNLFSAVILVALGCVPMPNRAHAGPPGSEDPFIPDPIARAKYQKGQTMLEAGPYFKQVLRCLPPGSELSGYIVKQRAGDKRAVLVAIRRKDKAELVISVVSSPNPKIIEHFGALGWSSDNTRFSPWPKGSPSGKPLGQSSTQALDPNQGLSYKLQVLDGPSLLNLKISAQINTDGKTNTASWKPITKADKLLLEHLARVMLRRLKTLHLTHDTFKP